ncbi:MAG: hypothetical protein IKU58_07115 [Clostridia bacterium]|nr:hypothetical protein [Clostridia bacterium]
MKQFRYSMLLFFAAAVFVAAGLISRPLLSGVKWAAVQLVQTGDVEAFIDDVGTSSKNLSYKGKLIDLYSLWYRATDTREVVKEDATVVRLDNDFLAFQPKIADGDTLSEMADACARLKDVTDGLEIPLLYVMAPNKMSLSQDGDNPVADNLDEFAALLELRSIPVLDLRDSMAAQGLTMESAYFHTDHHWLPETGLWAAGEIAGALGLDTDLLEPENYTVTGYDDLFLGSEGKKVGRYFTPLGLDDFSVITPNFDTCLTVNDYTGNRTGAFTETLLVQKNLHTEDPYLANPYVVYTGGDYPLQKVENHRSDQGERILVIRDSYACAVTPFLSLAADEVRTVDVRYWAGTQEADSILEYVRVWQPDKVVVLYAGVSPHMFDFE